MKKISFVAICSLFMATGCLQNYPENGSNGKQKACPLVYSMSTLSAQYNTNTPLPKYLSASVNGIAVVNECLMGSSNESYLLSRNSDRSVTIVFKIDGNAALRDMYFTDSGEPKGNVGMNLVIRGRNDCSSGLVSVGTMARSLNWQPLYSGSDKSCGPSGYYATVGN